MRYPTYTADFRLPDADTVHQTTRMVENKDVLRREIEALGGEVLKIKLEDRL